MLKVLRRFHWGPVVGCLLCVISALLMLGLATLALAQPAEAIPGLPSPVDQTQALVVAIYAAVLPFAVALIRKFAPTMPRLLVWSLPPVLGGLVAWLTQLGGIGGWKGLAAGLIAIAFREFASTLKEHGLNG
jgi:hypothetical protein